MPYLITAYIAATSLVRGVIVVEGSVFLVDKYSAYTAAAVRKHLPCTPVGTGHVGEHIHGRPPDVPYQNGILGEFVCTEKHGITFIDRGKTALPHRDFTIPQTHSGIYVSVLQLIHIQRLGGNIRSFHLF